MSNRVKEKNMDEIQQFVNDLMASSTLLHDRSNKQKTFDDIVLESLNRGEELEIAIKDAATQMPEMSSFASRAIPELNKYYSKLESIVSETALANNFRMMAKMRENKNSAIFVRSKT